MAPRRRRRLTPTTEWQVLQEQFRWPEQRTYELVRPIVLFGQSAAERAQQTGVSERTIFRTASLFDAEGLAGFLVAKPRRRGRPSSPELQAAILALHAEYPALRPYQIGTICFVRFGQRPSVPTIARALAQHPEPAVQRRYPPYAKIGRCPPATLGHYSSACRGLDRQCHRRLSPREPSHRLGHPPPLA